VLGSQGAAKTGRIGGVKSLGFLELYFAFSTLPGVYKLKNIVLDAATARVFWLYEHITCAGLHLLVQI
jgi:hypothetical protein